MTVTLKQVAEHAGVSLSTAAKVLRGQAREGRISDARASSIMSVAQKLNYRPHAAAVATATGRFNTISVVVGGTEKNPGFGWMPMSLMSGISHASRARNLMLSVAELSDELLTDGSQAPQLLRQWSTDGLLVNYLVHWPPRLAEMVKQYRIPSVWLNVKREHDCVHPDDLAAGRLATERLLSLGHRKVGYVGWHSEGGHYSEHDRFTAYEATMRAAGLEPRSVLLSQADVDERPLHIGPRWLEALGMPTAVVVYKEMDATRLQVGAAQMGLRVPEDLSIVTFVDEWSRSMDGMPFTAVKIPFSGMGRQAVELLAEKIERRSPLPAAVIAPTGIEVGQTASPLA